ncbi:MAG: hypothetical protein RML34_05495 [Leptospiraceae bacterium]|nr:hypothetical protein [Leptospiraceae bacterium]
MGAAHWENEVRALAQECLREDLRLYDFQVQYHKKGVKIVVVLDKLSDPYGSPNIGDCSEFSRRFSYLLKVKKPSGLQEGYTLEVSSPGAERELKTKEDIYRFRELPMRVVYRDEEKKKQSAVVYYLSHENGKFRFRYAELKKKNKGKQKEFQGDELIVDDENLLRIQLYVGL